MERGVSDTWHVACPTRHPGAPQASPAIHEHDDRPIARSPNAVFMAPGLSLTLAPG